MICKERFEQERFAVFKAPGLAHQATHVLSRGLEKPVAPLRTSKVVLRWIEIYLRLVAFGSCHHARLPV